jgi:hypothetical protein
MSLLDSKIVGADANVLIAKLGGDAGLYLSFLRDMPLAKLQRGACHFCFIFLPYPM